MTTVRGGEQPQQIQSQWAQTQTQNQTRKSLKHKPANNAWVK